MNHHPKVFSDTLQLFLIFTIMIVLTNELKAQIGISSEGVIPDSSAILDLSSKSKGLLIPRMNRSDIQRIEKPTNGLLVFNEEDNKFYAYISLDTLWRALKFDTDTIAPLNSRDTLLDSRDGQVYATVKIGNQWWMAENLNIGNMILGAFDQTDDGTIEKYCYDNDPANCVTYGGLYQWDEMMQYTTIESTQGVCPIGWHLPSDEEWKTLEMFLGMTQAEADDTDNRGTDQGSQLASNEPLWMDGLLDMNAVFGSSGFDALPGGYRSGTNSSFYSQSYYTSFWSSSESGTDAWFRSLSNGITTVYRFAISPAVGAGVRCVKD
jgi:uncharacterized protein (TIGR02145 family)